MCVKIRVTFPQSQAVGFFLVVALDPILCMKYVIVVECLTLWFLFKSIIQVCGDQIACSILYLWW